MKEKERLRPKDESSICRKSISRKIKFHEDSFLSTRAKSEPALNLAHLQRYRTLLPRKRSPEFQTSNMSLKNYRPEKIPFPANGIRVKDLLDVRVHPEHRPLGYRTEKCLGVTSYPLTNEGTLSHPCNKFKVRRRLTYSLKVSIRVSRL